jgi:hypothetical protein
VLMTSCLSFPEERQLRCTVVEFAAQFRNLVQRDAKALSCHTMELESENRAKEEHACVVGQGQSSRDLLYNPRDATMMTWQNELGKREEEASRWAAVGIDACCQYLLDLRYDAARR